MVKIRFVYNINEQIMWNSHQINICALIKLKIIPQLYTSSVSLR